MDKTAQSKFIYHGEGEDGILHHWFAVRSVIHPTRYPNPPSTVDGLKYDYKSSEEPPMEDRSSCRMNRVEYILVVAAVAVVDCYS